MSAAAWRRWENPIPARSINCERSLRRCRCRSRRLADFRLSRRSARPNIGAPLVVLGAPLTIDADSFKTASGNLEDKLRLVCDRVHAYRT